MLRTLAFAASFSILLADAALAAPPATTASAVALVQRVFLAPLAAQEGARSRYSRMAMPPSERRTRVVGDGTDAAGAKFVRFAVDERFPFADDWRKDVMTGCAYLDTGAVFVKRGAKLRPAGAYLGRKTADAPEGACVSTTTAAR